MAIIKSLAIGKAKGSMGGITYRYLSGETVGSGKIAFAKNPRTYLQMLRRSRWANLVNLWKALNDQWHPSFESAVGRVSDFNRFMGVNIAKPSAQVYLSKQSASAGSCVVAPVVMTEGSLPSVQNEIATGVLKSDITVGTLALDEETTVAAFSDAVVLNNINFAYGDQITLVELRQFVDAVNGEPYVIAEITEITLDGGNSDLLIDVAGTAISVIDNKLGSSAAVNGGACFIHSRLSQGQTLVSNQSLIVANSILSTYQGATARDTSIVSYGGKLTVPLLTPNITDIVAPD